MKTNYLNKISSAKATLLAGLFLVASFVGKAQCNANFTRSLGANGNVNVQSTSSGTFASTMYSWSFTGPSGPYISGGLNASHTYTTNGLKWICLKINDTVVNCTSTWCDSILVNNVTPSGTTTPCQASFTHTLGANGAVYFTSTSTNTTLGTHFLWSFGGGAMQNGTSAAYTYSTNGVKTVCLFISDTIANCFSTVCDSVYITNISGGTPCNHNVMYTLSKDSSVALTWNAWPVYPANVSNATWYWGDGSSSTGLYPSHTYSAAGTYSTCVTVSVSCDSLTGTYCYVAGIFKSTENNQMISLNVRQSGITGIRSEAKASERLNIYPNPNNGSFVIDLGGEANGSQVYVYNMLGEMVYQTTMQSAVKQNITVGELPEGTYFVKVISNNSNYNKKINIQK